MRAKVFLWFSLLLNLALTALVLHSLRRIVDRTPSLPPAADTSVVSTNPPKTHVVVRRQFFSWGEIESEDYPTYIANLREIGCPEPTIRDIIVAEVNLLYAHKRQQEVEAIDQPWWRSEPDWSSIRAAGDKLKALDAERQALLARLLGPNWDASAVASSSRSTNAIQLAGAVLGQLLPEVKQKVGDITDRAQQRLQAYRQAQQQAGKAEDPADLARLRQQTRQELAQVLNPQQLEEYLLRYSVSASQMRQELSGFNTTPDEFKQIFRVRDSFDQQIQLNYNGSDPVMVKKRKDLEQQRDAAIKQAIGPERFRFYQLTQDPSFQQARSTAEATGAPVEAVMPMYQINQLALKEEQRIKNDASLSVEERDKALKSVVEEQEKSLRKIISPPNPAPARAAASDEEPPPTPGKY